MTFLTVMGIIFCVILGIIGIGVWVIILGALNSPGRSSWEDADPRPKERK